MKWIKGFWKKCRYGLIVAAGFIGGFLLGWLTGNWSRDEEEERLCEREYEQRLEAEAEAVKEEARQEVLSLDDAEFDRAYPEAGRSAEQAGDRYLDRAREYFYKRRSSRDRSGSDGDSTGGH